MTQRLAYLDNLKILLVVGVIALHAAITYGLDGSWYLESFEEMSGGAVVALTIVLGTGWLFGLGLFFLVAGRLSARSLASKRAARFARDRVVRLGIPVVAYMLLVSPVLEYVAYRENDGGTGAFWPYVREQLTDPAPGPTWFLEALLLFSLVLALWRGHRGTPSPAPARTALTGRRVAAVALLIAVASFTAHLAFPVGSEQLHLQLGMFPQYVVLFALGVIAGRRGWLETIDRRLERRCAIAGAATALILPVVLAAGGFFDGGAAEDRFAGGWHWQAAALSLAEATLATCVSLWAVAFFRRRANRTGRLGRAMAPAAYGAFFVHPPVIVALAFALSPLDVPAELKFVALVAAGVGTSFALASLLMRAGPVAAVLGSGSDRRPRRAVRRSVRAASPY